MPSIRVSAVVGPSHFATPSALKNEMTGVLKQAKRVMEDDYKRTFRTWHHKPKVVSSIVSSNEAVVGVDRSDENGRIWGYVTDGTVPHVIRPVRARRLRFFTGGTPKTSVGSIVSGPGSPGTTGPIFSQEVHHPGTEGRHFDELIGEKNEQLVTDLVQAALNRLAR